MSLLNNKLSTSMLLAIGLSLPLLAQAESKAPVEGEAMVEDCILPAEVEAMTDEQRAKLTLPICIDEADAEKDKAAQEPAIVK